ncbi:MAG: hypothetical protein FVQ83_05420 [Chloroflexi bacterium]|nr:hypothetical protein [Chloroflexota bacterium]
MSKSHLEISPPLLNAAGSLGFYADKRGPIDLSSLGAFITNPISKTARKPPLGTRLIEFPGVALLHTGHPNLGFRTVMKRYAARWERAAIPIIVHLLASDPRELGRMISRIEELENISAVEIGFRQDIAPQAAIELTEAALGELPVIVRLPFTRTLELANLVDKTGAAAISLGPPRGALPNKEGNIVHGRMYGPAIFPQALVVVRELAAQGLPVIGVGGIYTPDQAEMMLAAGAIAVQLDAVLWRGDWESDK